MNDTQLHIFLTGCTGYIGKHIALLLLKRGYNVTASMRNRKIQEQLRKTLSKHLNKEDKELPSWESRLSCVELDLSSDESTWREALSTRVNNQCVSVLIHLASPCPEQAVWEIANRHPELQVTTILPSFVLGAPLDSRSVGT